MGNEQTDPSSWGEEKGQGSFPEVDGICGGSWEFCLRQGAVAEGRVNKRGPDGTGEIFSAIEPELFKDTWAVPPSVYRSSKLSCNSEKRIDSRKVFSFLDTEV